MTAEATRRGDASDLRRELDVLGDAVLLLMRRRRESDALLGEQLRQAEQRVADSERRYAELEWRLAALETHLQRLVQDMHTEADASRIALLREEIRGFGADRGEPTGASTPVFVGSRVAAVPDPAPLPPPPREPVGVPVPTEPVNVPAPTQPVAARASNVTFWEALGTTGQDRAGVVLMGLGAVGVLYALLTQLHLG